MKNHKLSYFIFIWLMTFTLFISIAFGVIFHSLGYRYNKTTNKIELTGLLVIKTIPKEADVYIDGKKIIDKTPLRISNLLPKSYNIRVVKDGFIEWEKTFNIESGKASVFEDIYLFNNIFTNRELNDEDAKLFEKKIDNNIQIINSSEIYIKIDLDLIFVTRFSQNVNTAQSILNNKYVLYQIEKGVFIGDLNNQNIIPVVSLPNSDISQFRMISDEILLIKQNDKIVKIEIR